MTAHEKEVFFTQHTNMAINTQQVLEIADKAWSMPTQYVLSQTTSVHIMFCYLLLQYVMGLKTTFNNWILNNSRNSDVHNYEYHLRWLTSVDLYS